MLTLLFAVFFASSTDVMANFFQLPLMDVLWFFRFFVPLAPIVAYFLTYKICHEMRAAEHIGQRKRALVVARTDEGEYVTAVAAPRPGDRHEELDAIPVPTFIDTTDPELATGGRRPPGHPLTPADGGRGSSPRTPPGRVDAHGTCVPRCAPSPAHRSEPAMSRLAGRRTVITGAASGIGERDRPPVRVRRRHRRPGGRRRRPGSGGRRRAGGTRGSCTST